MFNVHMAEDTVVNNNDKKENSNNLSFDEIETFSYIISQGEAEEIKIQIVVSQVLVEESSESATDIKIRTMTRHSANGHSSSSSSVRSKLPPLILPGDTNETRSRNRFQSPSRIPIPTIKMGSGKRSLSLSPCSHNNHQSDFFRKSQGNQSPSINSTIFDSLGSASYSTSSTSTLKTTSVGGTHIPFNSLPSLTHGQNHHRQKHCSDQQPRPKSTSKYHQNCMFTSPGSEYSSFLSLPYVNSRRSSSPSSSISYHRNSSGSNLLSPTFYSSPQWQSRKGSTSSTDDRILDSSQVEQYLRNNPDFMTSYIQRNVDMETLQQWLVDRHQSQTSRKLSLSKWKFGNGSEKCSILKHLAVQLRRNPPEGNVLWELALCISSAVSASGFVLYLLDVETNSLRRFSPLKTAMDFETYSLDDPKVTLATYVAKRREPQRMSRKDAELQFPGGLGDDKANLEQSCYVLCHPIIKADAELSGVIELHRQDPKTPFYIEDEEIVNSYLVWGGIALHYADLNSIMNKHKKLNDFLLGVVRSIFQDMVSMDIVIKKVMNFAQKLVDADRASLFLLDSKTKELYARLFDMGGGQDLKSVSDSSVEGPVKEIRFPIGTGIAGQVAATGGVLNIPDAYKDDRFNRNVDNMTGYVTKSILCMPVFIRGTVIGVVQMVNKKHGTFTKDDEDAFETFAVYCGLALHHAKLYDKIRRSEQKYKVALEVLSYHNTCTEEEFEKARNHKLPEHIIGIDDFLFKAMSVDNWEKVQYSVFMFVDLFGLTRFDLDSLYKFVLTVKKNYRLVPYHNWSHGFTVANCMYCILKKTSVFRPLECLALYIGSLCHDLDHRGRNNKFMLETASPLASIYSTSTLEHHHFNQTVTILQQEGHNIFAKLSSEEYKQVLGNIKHCILATDLALFFTNKARITQLYEKDAFAWGVPDHRLLAQAIAMTASDLCASAKPWDAQSETVQVIFQEFYEQGDLEKKAGRTPIPMMDRDKVNEQPASQVGFLNGICIPCYDLLYKLLPETVGLLEGCKANLGRWLEQVEEQKQKTAKAVGK